MATAAILTAIFTGMPALLGAMASFIASLRAQKHADVAGQHADRARDAAEQARRSVHPPPLPPGAKDAA